MLIFGDSAAHALRRRSRRVAEKESPMFRLVCGALVLATAFSLSTFAQPAAASVSSPLTASALAPRNDDPVMDEGAGIVWLCDACPPGWVLAMEGWWSGWRW